MNGGEQLVGPERRERFASNMAPTKVEWNRAARSTLDVLLTIYDLPFTGFYGFIHRELQSQTPASAE